METINKIHPGIGIARIGNSPDRFFIGSEGPGAAPLEIHPSGEEKPLGLYKHEGKVKRQAARFRVFAYERDAVTGALGTPREITAADATITWRVTVANTKNEGMPIRPEERSIAGRSAGPAEMAGSTPRGPIKLGDLRTDSDGRLLVLGGHGLAATGGQKYDDVSDGWVKATVQIGSGAPVEASPAWVICASPDYAPTRGFFKSLYAVCYQRAKDQGLVRPPARPSFQQDILPMLRSAAGLRWVHQNAAHWADPDLQRYRELGSADRSTRDKVAGLLRNPGGLADSELTEVQKHMLTKWVDGDFDDKAPGLVGPVPGNLERAALELTTAQFGPGIEASRRIGEADYSEPFRLQMNDDAAPGMLTEGLSIFPWHVDYAGPCNTHWWPSQRPDLAPPNAQRRWLRPAMSGEQMIADWYKLGFVLPRPGSPDELEERERDPSLPEA